jgi:phosphopantetheine adenylyltransferase
MQNTTIFLVDHDGMQMIHSKNVKQLQQFKDYLDDLEPAAPVV